MNAKLKAMKGNASKSGHLLTLDQGCFHTHRKLENSHFLSTGSSPPEKTIRVKKNDNVILGHLKRCRVLIQPHIKLHEPTSAIPLFSGPKIDRSAIFDVFVLVKLLGGKNHLSGC
jgi:hypothetical protein